MHDVKIIDPDAAPSAELARGLGVDFVPSLLELALTHRSYAVENGGIPDNQRLEFLGDSILGQAVTVMLYRTYPDYSEGQLSRLRASLVSTVALAEIARGLGLGAYLHLGRGEHLTGGNKKDSVLADTVEAVIGAAYLSAGVEVATELVLRLVEPKLAVVWRLGAEQDPKTALQELADTQGAEPPRYEVEGSGLEHDRSFTATVTVLKKKRILAQAQGVGTSKKQAEVAGALAAWHQLNDGGDGASAGS